VYQELVHLAYVQKLVDSVINRKRKNRDKTGDNVNKTGCVNSILYIRGFSEKFKRIGTTFNTKLCLNLNTP
jgi:hypothetical protein